MRRLALVAALALAGGALPAPAWAGRFEGTNPSFPKVLERAKASKRLVLIDVVRPDCVWCQALERDTFSDARVAAALDGFVLARYDAETEGGRGVAQRYRVRGFPTLVVVDAAGQEVDRLVGFSPPETFLAETERIRAGEATLPVLAAAHAKAPGDPAAAIAYAKKLARAGDPAAAAVLDPVVAAAAAGSPGRLETLLARADVALERGDSDGAMAAWQKVVDEAPRSDAAADARVARVRRLASEGSVARALEEAEAARGVVKDPARLASIEEVAFRLQRAGLERTLVRWGEGAAEAKDAAALHGAALAALESGVALGSALRWVERAADLSKRAPEVLDTWARLHAALLAYESAVARGREALAAGLSGPARDALAASVARWEAALAAPPEPGPDAPGAAGPAGRDAPDAAPAPPGAVPPVGTPARPPSSQAAPDPRDPCPPSRGAASVPDPCPPSGMDAARSGDDTHGESGARR